MPRVEAVLWNMQNEAWTSAQKQGLQSFPDPWREWVERKDYPPASGRRAFKGLLKGWINWVEHAAKVGVRLGVEVLNRYENNLINTAKQARRLIELVQSPFVGIHLDTFHMNIEEEDMAGAINLAGDKLFHLHGSDSHRGIPGEGHVPWGQVASALRKIRYNGYVVIESFDPEGRLAPLARLWRPLSDSQDTLARQGLAFLRENLLAGSSGSPSLTDCWNGDAHPRGCMLF